jgi:hypothetical protein
MKPRRENPDGVSVTENSSLAFGVARSRALAAFRPRIMILSAHHSECAFFPEFNV